MKSLLFVLLSASALLAPASSQPVGSFELLKLRSDVPPQTPAKKPTIAPSEEIFSPPGAPSKEGLLASINIDDYISSWMDDETNSEKLAHSAGTTNGGWECWAQFELEYVIKKRMGISTTTQVREVRVYEDQSLAADFAFDPLPTSNKKGIILELKCENRKMTNMKALVRKDIEKLKKPLKAKYQDYDRAAFVMAYTPKAQQDMQDLGMTPLTPSIQLVGAEKGNTLKVFRKED